MTKTKVFSGILFDIYQREQEQFDGSVKTFEMINKINSTFVIATVDKKIIITHQTQPGKSHRYYNFLGGMVPRGITESEQAKNELLEESGMISDNRSSRKIYTSGTSKIDRETHMFIARNCHTIADQTLDPGGENINLIRISFDEMIEMICNKRLGRAHLRADILQMKVDGSLPDFRKLIFGS